MDTPQRSRFFSGLKDVLERFVNQNRNNVLIKQSVTEKLINSLRVFSGMVRSRRYSETSHTSEPVMGHALKERSRARTSSAVKPTEPKTENRGGAFNGVVTLDAVEFAQFEKCMMDPGEPTELILQGDALLQKLYGH